MAPLLLMIAAVGLASPVEELSRIATALRSAPAWQAVFAQRYVPAGLDEGIEEGGELILVPPFRLRFDYDYNGRVFATDGLVVRLVDQGAGTCDAFHLDQELWGRTPLAALLDEEQAKEAFFISWEGKRLRLVPREGVADVVEILIVAGESGLPTAVHLTDVSGNVNELHISRWQRISEPTEELFRPSLPGQAPCIPPE